MLKLPLMALGWALKGPAGFLLVATPMRKAPTRTKAIQDRSAESISRPVVTSSARREPGAAGGAGLVGEHGPGRLD